MANWFAVWFQTARNKSWIQPLCLKMAILICCTVISIHCTCILSLILGHLEMKNATSLQVSKTQKCLMSHDALSYCHLLCHSHLIAVCHGDCTKCNRHLFSRYGNFAAVYKVVTSFRNCLVFKIVHVYSFLLSECNKTCRSSRCDFFLVSSLFAKVSVISWSSVIVNIFVILRQKLCKIESFRWVLLEPVCKQTCISFPSKILILQHNGLSLPDAILQLLEEQANDFVILW